MRKTILCLVVLTLSSFIGSGAFACKRASASCLVNSFNGQATAPPTRTIPAPLKTPSPPPVPSGSLTGKFATQARDTSRRIGPVGNTGPGAMTDAQVKGIGTSVGKLKSAAGASQAAGDFRTAREIGAQIRKAEQTAAAAKQLQRAKTGRTATERMKRFNTSAAQMEKVGKDKKFKNLQDIREENIYNNRKSTAVRDNAAAKRPTSVLGSGLSNPPNSLKSSYEKTKKRPPLKDAFNRAATRTGVNQVSGKTGSSATAQYPTLDLDQ